MPKVTIIGTTSWGITLGTILARNEVLVELWARTEQEANRLTKNGVNHGEKCPAQLSVNSSMSEVMADTTAVILVVPSQSMRENMKLVAEHLEQSTIIISAAKGLEIGSNKRMSQVIADEIDPSLHSNICILSGPNLSQEILDELPSATVISAADEKIARQAQKILTTPKFCVFTNTDIVGVELGGALKNIIALGAGIADGLGYGDNTKAALITRGLTEMTALGVSLGANPLTFSGLAGLGDLMATCASPLSRNHYVGVELTKGRPLKEITDSMDGIAEGVGTTMVVWKLAHEMELEMPITETIHRILFEDADIHQAAIELMTAGTAHELAGRKWRLFHFLQRRWRRQ